jgi:tetratricopeptide (TPR) repeat protein
MFEEGLLALHSDRTAAGLLHEQSAESFGVARDPWWAAVALREAGRAAFYQGAHDEATRLIERSLNIRRALGDRRGIADSLDGLGIVAMYRGKLDEAERLLRESVAMAQASSDTETFTSAIANLGASLAVAGQLDEGRAALFEAVRVLGDLGRGWSLAHAQAMMSLVSMWCGKLDDALAESATAATLSEEMGYWRGSALASLVRGGVALARQDYHSAESRARDSVALLRKIRQRDDLGYALALLSAAEVGVGKRAEAREHACEAVRLAAEIGSYIATIGLPACLPALACGSQAGQISALCERLVSELPLVSRSLWYRQVIQGAAPDLVVRRFSGPGRLSRDIICHGEVWSIVADLAAEMGCSPSGSGIPDAGTVDSLPRS